MMTAQPTEQPLWTDDQRPWVNEELSSGSTLGVAARTVSRWGKDWHRDKKDPDQYQSAHNDIADMADAITSLLVEQDTLTAALQQAQQEAADDAAEAKRYREMVVRLEGRNKELEAELAAMTKDRDAHKFRSSLHWEVSVGLGDECDKLAAQLAEARTRLSGTEAAYEDIEAMMFGDYDEGDGDE